MSWIVMAMLAAAPTTIAIDGSTACAPRQVLERELRRAPVQFVEGAAALIVRLAPEGASHRLLVRDASGAIVIERVLPTAACQEAGVAAALIIDRALRDIVVRLPPSVTRDATAKDATKNDATKNDATKNDATKNDAAKNDAAKNDAAKNDATKNDAAKNDAAKNDATKSDATKSDATKNDATKNDATKSDATKSDATKNDATKNDATKRVRVLKETPADTTSRDTTSRDTTPRDTTPRDTTPRDTTSRDTTPRDTTSRDTTSRDTTSRDTTSRDTTSRDTTSRDTTSRDTTSRDTTPRDTTPRDTTPRDTTPRDTTPRETTRDDTPPIPPRVSPRNAAASDTTSPRATTSRDTTSPPDTTPTLPRPTLTNSTTRTPTRSVHVFADEPVESRLRRLRFEATAGAGLNAPNPSTISALLSADAALNFSPWRFGLLAAFSFGSSTLVLDDLTGRERGTLTTRALFVLPHAMVCLERTISLCGGVRAGARIAIGSAAGPYIFQTRTVLAPTPTTGLGGRVAFGIGPVLFALDLSLLVNLTTRTLQLQGLNTSVETPRFDLLLTLSAGGRTR